MTAILVNGHTITETYCESICQDYGVPSYMANSLFLYLQHGLPPGSFLTAILSNNFMEAVSHADANNARCLKEWAQLIYCALPSGSHGSREAVRDWIHSRQEATCATADE